MMCCVPVAGVNNLQEYLKHAMHVISKIAVLSENVQMEQNDVKDDARLKYSNMQLGTQILL